jgi:hypothetical protein
VNANVAALFVSVKGPYYGRNDVDAWDEGRDAREYGDCLPVVSHPPCARWCRLAKFIESRGGAAVGDDDGCFASALENVNRCGGVIEHPAWSLAWGVHGLIAPPARGWQWCLDGYWVCEVAQSAYGHPAQKLTWLYYVGRNPPEPARWERPSGTAVVSYCYRGGRGRSEWGRDRKRLKKRRAEETPREFAEYLLSLARNCGGAP